MKASRFIRIGFGTAAGVLLCTSLSAVCAMGQDVGVDASAGIFRAKNPEARKRSKPATRRGTKPVASNAAVEDRVEDLLGKGNEFRDERRFAEAEASYRGILKIKPRDGRAAYGLGNIYFDQQRWDEAEISYRDAVMWSPTDVDGLVALSVVLVQPRAGADNAKRFAEAEGFARRAVALAPKNAIAWDRLGVALQSRGVWTTETEQAYRRAVELDPQFAVAYAHLGRVLNKMGRPTDAAPLYDQAGQLAKDAATLNLIAESLQAEQQWENSEPVLKRALELDARNATSLLLMGRVLSVFKRFQEAEPHLKLATEVSPRAFEPHHLLGSAYLAMERYEEAEATYERALGFASPGDRKQLAGAYGLEGVGDGYLKAKKKPSAARAYSRALELDPGNKRLEQKLKNAR